MTGHVDVDVADEAARLRHGLVRSLIVAGWLGEPRVVAALEAVPRHVFVPGVPLQEAYANDVVHTKFAEDGRPISAAYAIAGDGHKLTEDNSSAAQQDNFL